MIPILDTMATSALEHEHFLILRVITRMATVADELGALLAELADSVSA